MLSLFGCYPMIYPRQRTLYILTNNMLFHYLKKKVLLFLFFFFFLIPLFFSIDTDVSGTGIEF